MPVYSPNGAGLIWLMVLTILKHMSSSVGMSIPNIWENRSHVPNHQPVIVVAYLRPSTLSPGANSSGSVSSEQTRGTLLKVPTSSSQTIPSGYVKIAIENGHL